MSIPDNEEKAQEAFQPQQGCVSEEDTGIEAEHPGQVLQWEWGSGTIPAARAPPPFPTLHLHLGQFPPPPWCGCLALSDP